MRISSKWNKFIQGVAIAGHVATFATPFLPESAKIPVMVALSAAQAAAGTLASYSNPDGTPAEAAWDKKRK